MNKILTQIGLILFGLIFFGLTILQFERRSKEKKEKIYWRSKYDSLAVIKPDTAYYNIPPVHLAHQNPVIVKPNPSTMQPCEIKPSDSLIPEDYTDSIIDKNLVLKYTITTLGGVFQWISFDYQVKCPQVINMPAPDPVYVSKTVVQPSKTKILLQATGLSDQSMLFGVGFILPSNWGIHAQGDPFQSRWGFGVNYTIK